LNPAIEKLTPILITALVLIGLIGCQSRGSSHNRVKPVGLDEFDQIIHSKTFSGLVAVIASWCPPCRKELPVLAKLDRRYRDHGIQIVVVSIDVDGAKAVQPLVDKTGIDFPAYWIGPSAVQFYKIIGVPTLLVMRNGQQIAKLPGSHSSPVIENQIKKLINP
jgi:thiol-disulfide isomerase/thioredoxin